MSFSPLVLALALTGCSEEVSDEAAPEGQELAEVPDRFTTIVLPETEEAPAEVAAVAEPLAAAEPTDDGDASAVVSDERTREIGDELGGLLGAKGIQAGGGGRGARGTSDAVGVLGTTGQGRAAHGSAAGAVAKSEGYWRAPRQRLERDELPPASGEGYEDYGVNELTLSSEDALSTFSIDVDTASYTIARRKLLDGYLPPEAAVRVEEFVNYFPYAYVQPTGEAPFAVNMEAAPNPFSPGHHVLRVGVQGREVEVEDRKPARLTFLVDVSGSMSSYDKLGLAKRALHHLVDQLGPEDSVALGTYAGATRKVLDPTAASERDAIHAAIESLSSGGGTAMSSGVEMAYQMAQGAFVPGAENRVVVLSDGDANIGPASHEAILHQIQHHAKEGITLTTVGFGMGNYQDVMMEQLANKGDGNYFYIDGYSEAKRVFGQDLSGTIQTIARDVKIQVAFDEDAVYAYRLIGYENRDIADRDFRTDKVDAGEVGSGHRVTALYDVVLAEGFDGEAPLATVRLRNKPPGPDAPAVEWVTQFAPELLREDFEEASWTLRLAFGAASFAEILRGSPYAAELSYAEVRELVAGAARNKEALELVELIETAAQLAGEPSGVAAR